MRLDLAAVALILLTMFFALDCKASEVWLNTDIRSYHLDRSGKYNETHDMLSLEYISTNNTVIMLSNYNNSFEQDTWALQVGKQFGTGNGIYYSSAVGISYGYDQYYGTHEDTWYENHAYIVDKLSLIASQSVGFKYKRSKTTLSLIGVDTFLWTVGYKF